MTAFDYELDGEVFEWNPSISCFNCDADLIAKSITFPGRNIKPRHRYECTECDENGPWSVLARIYGIK